MAVERKLINLLPPREIDINALLQRVNELERQNMLMRNILEQSKRQQEHKMQKWLEVQNQHKNWTQCIVNDLFSREQGRLKKLTAEAVGMLNTLNTFSAECVRLGYVIPEHIRKAASEKALSDRK